MDELQKVEIALQEYMELKEIYEHRKEVKITETIFHKSDETSHEWTGLTVGWKSDGKCWLHLTDKLHRSGLIIKENSKLIKLLETMSVKDFKKWQKTKK